MTATLGILLAGLGRILLAAGFLALLAVVGYTFLPRVARTGRAVCDVPLGLSFGVIAWSWLAWVTGTLAGTRAIPFVAAVVLAGAWWRRRNAFAAAGRVFCRLLALARRSPFLSASVALLLGSIGVQLLLPLVDSDGIRYQVALPKLFLLAGKVLFYPWDPGGAYPQAVGMLVLTLLPLGGGEVAKALHALFLAGALGVLALFLHRGPVSRTAAVVGPLLLLASPVAALVAPTGFVDHAALFHVAVAILLLRRPVRPLAVGIALGAALATKLTVAPAVAAVGLAAVALAEPGRRVRAAAAVGGAALLAWAPWGLQAIVKTGDPVFPAGYVLLGRTPPGFTAEGVGFTVAYRGETGAPTGLLWSGLEEGARLDDVVGIHFLLALFLLPVVLKERSLRPLLLVVLPYLFVALVAKPPARYLLPLLWGLAGIAATGLARLAPRRGAAVALLAALPAAVLSVWGLVTMFDAPDYLAGRLGREELLARVVPGYRAARDVNRRPGGTIMALDFPGPYYLERPWVAEGILVEPPLRRWLAEGADAEGLLARCRGLGVTHIVVTPGWGGGTAASLYPLARSRREAEALLAFRSRLRLLATIDGVDVFELR